MEEKGVGTHWELEDKMDAWDRAWGNIMREIVPEIQLRIREREHGKTKWITPEIKGLIKHRTQMEKMAREQAEQWTPEMEM